MARILSVALALAALTVASGSLEALDQVWEKYVAAYKKNSSHGLQVCPA